MNKEQRTINHTLETMNKEQRTKNNLKRIQIIVKGPNVQRCGFRREAARLAKEKGLSGYAAYFDRDVLIEVEGPEQILNEYMEWCRSGPDYCEIGNVEVSQIELIGGDGFNVKHGVTTYTILNKTA